MLNTVAKVFNAIYTYRAGPSTLGVGVENMALEMPGRAISSDYYSPKYNVRGELDPYSEGYVKFFQDVPNDSLRANGVYLSGELALASLVEFNRQVANQK